MTARPARIAPQLQVNEVAPGEVLECYRTVKVASLDHPELPLSFRSHYEEGLKPRYQQTQHAALHMAVSFWKTEEVARSVAIQFPKHGSHIAKVALEHGHGFNYLDPALEQNPQHLTIWGSAENLASATVDIVPVDQ